MTFMVKNMLQNRVAALGDATIVAVNEHDNTKVPIPEALKHRIRDLQKWSEY
jgi:hypothetical protein